MSRTVTILSVTPGKSPEIREIDGINGPVDKSLAIIYKLIDADMMEVRRPFPMRPDVVLVCDEEGKFSHNRARPNRRIPELNDVIYGPFFFAKMVEKDGPDDEDESEEFGSLTASEVAWLMGRFGSSGDF